MKILLVDDETVALRALEKRVDWLKYGFTNIYTAENAIEARKILGEHQIDLILCDIEMPGENGLELLQSTKEQYPLTESIIITCHADFNYLKKAMKNGIRDYILKPIDYEELDSLLQQFADEKQSRRELEQIGNYVKVAQESRNRDSYAEDADVIEQRIIAVKDYIEEHLHEKITVTELAGLVTVNEQYFMRMFKRKVGQSAIEYITERRILRAGKLLTSTDYSINFIADCVGCESMSYFSKIFKKYTGFSPREYRENFKKS